jgi:hypothetical protein
VPHACQIIVVIDCAGPGETINPSGSLALPRDGRIITLWNYDVAAFNAGVNLYGSNPFVLQLFQGGSPEREATLRRERLL